MRQKSSVLLFLFTSYISLVSTIPALPSLILPTPISESNQTLLLQQNQTANLSRIDILGNAFKCYDAKLFASRRANWGDCARAVALLPNFHVPGKFIEGPLPNVNPLHLPHQESWESCRVTVDLKQGVLEEESSWLSINVASTKIIDACRVGQGDYAKTGGNTSVGTRGDIEISIEKDRDKSRNRQFLLDDGDDNSTATS